MAEANILLDAFLERAALSHAGLAKQLNSLDDGLRYDHASVARWIRDHAIPRDPVPVMICRILGDRLGTTVTPADIGMTRDRTGTDPPGLPQALDRAAALWRSDQRGHRPRSTVTGPQAIAPVWEWENPPEDDDVSHLGQRQVDPADIARLQHARARYQEMYRRVGGVPVKARIMDTLTGQAAPLLRAAYDNTRGRELYRAVGGLTALAGVCAYDADQQPLAQRHLLSALRLAKASGDRAFGAYVVALMANQALYLDEYRLVVQYAQAGLRAAGTVISPALTADLHALAGKAYARMGNAPDSHQHLRHAETVAGRIIHDGSPVEVSYVQPGLVETQVAEALRRLGDLIAAQTYAEESVRTGATTHLRGQAHRYAGLSLILTARGNLERSVQTASQMLDRVSGMESGRLHDRVNQVISALRPHSTHPTVADLLERAQPHQTPTGT
ncbi:transcriptional regulator [Micromonospora craniellae]|uniref:Transcriptional regulator n=1 Tax=Micromonospora craniellae TaxID=2294034 RepID=A0A372FSZ1_9ACTN|nr:transcriptional regulator [Micromonospora craniellae]QOC89668.1 transcriptional regulator [Micromonospora craniellae]RFS43629.1 transcriptional regulator [Micromonospora craniellae]